MRLFRYSWVMTIFILPALYIAKPYTGEAGGMHSLIRTRGMRTWLAPDTATIPNNPEGRLIRYGRSLVANTSRYLGPAGTISSQTNGMNCQNCHLDAGTRPWGNNYLAVFSTYPRFRERSGTIETMAKRVNDCIERSLNGKALDTNSQEMQAILAYFTWLGKDVPHGIKPPGSGITEVPLLNRAADPGKGKLAYTAKCASCHMADGQGLLQTDQRSYIYPPLWGKHSYNTAAGLFRISRFAGYIKSNMPYGSATAETPVLTNEEAWDIAAYVNSMPRPVRKFKTDWPVLAKKPFDHPFGPFADSFPERQHKYGPFTPIKKAAAQLTR